MARPRARRVLRREARIPLRQQVPGLPGALSAQRGGKMVSEPISGELRDADSDQPVPGLQVEAWDTAQLFDHAIGSDESNADGAFAIPITDDLRRALISHNADVYFRLFHD